MSLFTSAEAAQRFILAGDAIVTISSLKTGRSYTLRWQHSPYVGGDIFVKLLTGPHNTSDYTYLGTYRPSSREPFLLTNKSKMLADSCPVLAVRYLVATVIRGARIPELLEVRHEGRCGRCARKLTVPSSIDRGIGPECAEILHIS